MDFEFSDENFLSFYKCHILQRTNLVTTFGAKKSQRSRMILDIIRRLLKMKIEEYKYENHDIINVELLLSFINADCELNHVIVQIGAKILSATAQWGS